MAPSRHEHLRQQQDGGDQTDPPDQPLPAMKDKQFFPQNNALGDLTGSLAIRKSHNSALLAGQEMDVDRIAFAA